MISRLVPSTTTRSAAQQRQAGLGEELRRDDLALVEVLVAVGDGPAVSASSATSAWRSSSQPMTTSPSDEQQAARC